MQRSNKLRMDPVLKIIMLALSVLSSAIALAHGNPAYSHDGGVKTSNPRWMTALKDDTLLSSLSLPGTHDTMAFYGGDAAQAQAMSLANQLESGIRVLDIRCRHIQDVFAIHHGMVFQKVYLGDVLNTVIAFLNKNPGETVFMRVKEEYNPENNKLTFEQVFRDRYWTPNINYFWQGTSDDPKLADVRGKIVVLQNFSADQRYGISYSSFTTQDDYKLNTNWDLYDKWTKVKTQLGKANQDTGTARYINFLSASTGSFPYFVASGHSSPGSSASRLATGKTTPGWKSWKDFPRVDCALGICTIAFEGTNILAYERLGKDYKARVGILMADFPGPGLIERTIELNNRFKK